MNANQGELQVYQNQDRATPMLNIYSLKKDSDSRTRNRFKIYETILKKCHHRIKVASTSHKSESYTFFVVPSYLVGMPTFDLESCCDYLIYQLSKNGFQIIRLANTLLFISWKHVKFDVSKEREMNECIQFLNQKSSSISEIGSSINPNQGHLHRQDTQDTQDTQDAFGSSNTSSLTDKNNKNLSFRSIHDAPSTEHFLML